MGCSDSSAEIVSGKRRNLITEKPRIWFITGGPGSQKGKVCQILIRDFKFKYLSAYDILQFWKERDSPDSKKIKQLIEQGKTFPSDLVARLVKQTVAYLGVRRYLIDDFPRNITDVRQFDTIVTSQDMIIQKIICIMCSRQTMVKSGIEAKTTDKTDKQEVQKMVTGLVDAYLKDSSEVLAQYKKKNILLDINGEQGPDQAYRLLRQSLQKSGQQPPKPISVFFSHFDNQDFENIYCDDLIRKYGFYFYSIGDLIEEAAFKKSPQSQYIKTCAKNKKQLTPQFVLSLVRKKIQKHDYSGSYLISGYPRFISDAQQWDKTFGWETDIKGYITFEIPDKQFKPILAKRLEKANPEIKKQEIDKQFDLYQQNQKEVCEFYQKKNKLLKVDCGNDRKVFAEIDQFLGSKGFSARKDLYPNLQVAFLSDLCAQATELANHIKQQNVVIIDFGELIFQRTKKQNIFFELITNHLKVGRPLPGFITVKILMEHFSTLKTTSASILIKGFPNTAEDLTVWEEEVGLTMKLSHIIFFETNKKFISDGVKRAKIMGPEAQIIELLQRHATMLEKKLINSDWKHTKIHTKDNPETYSQYVVNDLKKSEFLK